MTEKNERASIREKPDPMALRTKGRKTTYEKKKVAGIGARIRQVR